MIVITGASGFIGSAIVDLFNQKGLGFDLIVVDDFYKHNKDRNLQGKIIREWIHRDIFLDWFRKNHSAVDFVIHMGARTDTTEFDESIFEKLNIAYSKAIWKVCSEHQIPLIYASSAAVYGDGAKGFGDHNDETPGMEPLNPYGRSKHTFDVWALEQEDKPPYWIGLRFFNVFGPNEYHKGRMASVVFHAFRQIRKTGEMKLFRSHREDYQDGHQMRDFIYVKDVVDVIYQLYSEQKVTPGIYNLGTGQARTFKDLVHGLFKALGKEAEISFIDTPEDIRDTYQYYTQAEMDRFFEAGLDHKFSSLEDGIEDYVKNHLLAQNPYL